jgi:hypothetical protein
MRRTVMKFGTELLFLAVSIGTATAQSWPFQEYPATVFRGAPARPKLETPLAREHATIIRRGAIRGVNFAGHYRIIDWGCGTSCGVYVIVDERTGRVFEPPEISNGVDLGVAGPDFRPDSSLFVLANCPEPKVYGLKNCQRKFYRWDGARLMLLKNVPVTGG